MVDLGDPITGSRPQTIPDHRPSSGRTSDATGVAGANGRSPGIVGGRPRHGLRVETKRTLTRGVPHRHPSDLLRVVAGSAAFGIVMLIVSRSTISSFEKDVFRLVNDLPAAIEPPLAIIMQAGTIGFAVLVLAVALLLRKWRPARDVAASAVTAWLAAKLFKMIVSRPRPAGVVVDVLIRDSSTGLGFPSGHAAVAAALAGALSPYVSRPVRRAMWATAFVVGVARMYVGAHLPMDALGGWLLGWAIGSLVHVIFGSPNWVVTRAALIEALQRIGLAPAGIIQPRLDARGSTPYIVEDTDGRRWFVKALSRDQRDADWLFKATRFVLFRGLEDESPFATPKQQLEHEGYVAMLARRSGARVPRILEVVSIDEREALLVMESVTGSNIADAPDRVDDEVLDSLWSEVATLQRHRIAHRDLRAANIVVDEDRRPWIVDFGFAEASASTRQMGTDLAELLASLAPVVGVERASDAALRHIDPEIIRQCIPLLQPAVLSRATRNGLGSGGGVLEELRARLSEASGIVTPPAAEPLLRIRPRTILLVVVAAFAIHVLLPLVGETPRIVAALQSVHLDWLAVVLFASALTYAGAAFGLVAASPVALPYGRTLGVVLADSFTNRLAPGALGRIGLDVRYLMRQGATRPVAVGAESLNMVGGLVVHAAAIVVAGLIFGGPVLSHLNLPGELVIVVVVGGVLVGLGGLLVVGPWRRSARRNLGEALEAFRNAARQPARLVRLLAGSVVLNIGYILALQASLWAVGATVAAGTVTLVYLTADAVASASPTPGGLGAAEAAFVAALAATGVETNLAVAGVLVYRLFTFWLPTLLGWFSFRWLRRRQYV